MRAHQLKMNPTKSFLGMSSDKFLGFIVASKGNHMDPDKINAIQNMQPPKTLKELRGLQGRLVYIRRLIANLSGWCQPFTRLMKKGVSFVYDACLPERFWGCQRISHQASSPRSSSVGKIILTLCKSYGSCFGHPACGKEWWRLRTSYLLLNLNFDRGWMLLQPPSKKNA